MKKRCIMIFPYFKNIQGIDDIRRKYDPLADHVRPHITLAFPFESSIDTSELKAHIENVASCIKPFDIVLNGIVPSTSFGNYLFLDVKEGAKQIVELHKRLYSGILNNFYPTWLIDKEFLPHMTVGCIGDQEAFNKAVEETKNINDVFETIVEMISVEIIDENEDSIIELNVRLRGSSI